MKTQRYHHELNSSFKIKKLLSLRDKTRKIEEDCNWDWHWVIDYHGWLSCASSFILVLWRIIWWMIEFWCLKELRWIVVWRIRAKGSHRTLALVAVSSISSNLFLIIYWIKVGYGCGGGVACTKWDVCKKVKMLSKQAPHNLPNSSSNEAQKQFCVRVLFSLIFYALPHYLLALLFASAYRTIGKCCNRIGPNWCGGPWGHINYFRYFWF